MSTTASRMRKLHQLHIKFQKVQAQLDRGPKQIQARQHFVQRKQTKLETEKECLISLKKTADAKTLDFKTNDRKISELKSKLNMASSNREYDIIKGQIEADTMANSVLEDEILESLESVDQAQVEWTNLNEEYTVAKSEEERVAKAITAAEPDLKNESRVLESEISDAAHSLPAEVAVVYRRLVQAHGSNALAPVENGACSACNVDLSPQSRVELNSGKIIFCRPCGRMLYLPGNE